MQFLKIAFVFSALAAAAVLAEDDAVVPTSAEVAPGEAVKDVQVSPAALPAEYQEFDHKDVGSFVIPPIRRPVHVDLPESLLHFTIIPDKPDQQHYRPKPPPRHPGGKPIRQQDHPLLQTLTLNSQGGGFEMRHQTDLQPLPETWEIKRPYQSNRRGDFASVPLTYDTNSYVGAGQLVGNQQHQRKPPVGIASAAGRSTNMRDMFRGQRSEAARYYGDYGYGYDPYSYGYGGGYGDYGYGGGYGGGGYGNYGYGGYPYSSQYYF